VPQLKKHNEYFAGNELTVLYLLVVARFQDYPHLIWGGLSNGASLFFCPRFTHPTPEVKNGIQQNEDDAVTKKSTTMFQPPTVVGVMLKSNSSYPHPMGSLQASTR